MLFLHGNTGTRALRSRVQHYQVFAARLRANVLAPDYRGFADSTGTPSEVGLGLDALAAWDWLRAHGAPPENVLIVGNSLGTGVAVQFASALQELELEPGSEPQRPRGVVLLAPFSSIEALLDTYYIMGVVPLLAPLRILPFMSSESIRPTKSPCGFVPWGQQTSSHEPKKKKSSQMQIPKKDKSRRLTS